MALEFPDLKNYYQLKEITSKYFRSPGAVRTCKCKKGKEDAKIQEKI